MPEMKKCTSCGEEILAEAKKCKHCGEWQEGYSNETKAKGFVTTLLLCIFMGGIGAHRFYTGYVGVAVAQLLTAGGCGLWILIDLISILLGAYKDADGHKLAK